MSRTVTSKVPISVDESYLDAAVEKGAYVFGVGTDEVSRSDEI